MNTTGNDKRAKAPMSNKKYLAIWVPILALVTAILIVANMALAWQAAGLLHGSDLGYLHLYER